MFDKLKIALENLNEVDEELEVAEESIYIENLDDAMMESLSLRAVKESLIEEEDDDDSDEEDELEDDDIDEMLFESFVAEIEDGEY